MVLILSTLFRILDNDLFVLCIFMAKICNAGFIIQTLMKHRFC
uniref:Uncharacterized protein n=1 Tax=Anguilla anguilla TaxID=7936 RepID=A0A0E9P545_ANGAN